MYELIKRIIRIQPQEKASSDASYDRELLPAISNLALLTDRSARDSGTIQGYPALLHPGVLDTFKMITV
jgi:hypothetical protein